MNLKDKIKKLRKEKNWRQSDLAKKLDIAVKQVNRYENGLSVPSIETFANIAKAFGITMDFLYFNNLDDQAQTEISDKKLLEQFKIISKMNIAKKNLIKEMLDGLIIKNQVNNLS